MTQAEEKFELVLTMPAYRNWIGPDTAEMHVYVRGGDDRLLRAIQLRILVTEQDTDTVAQRLFLLEPFTRELTFPTPKLHSGGEVLAVLEDSENGQVLAEGRWNVRSLDAGTAQQVAYFDGRGILMLSGQAVFPIAAWPQLTWRSAQQVTDICAELKNTGYNAVSTAEIKIALADIAKTADKAGLGLLHQVAANVEPDNIVQWRDIGNLWGYILQNNAEDVVETYRLLRMKSNSRFCVLPLQPGDAEPAVGFNDVIAWDCSSVQEPTAADRFRPYITFAMIAVEDNSPAVSLRSCVFNAFIDRASGLIFTGPLNALRAESTAKVVKEASLAGDLVRLGHPIEWSRADREQFAQQKLQVWAYRHRDQFLCAVRSSAKEAGNVRIPVPMPAGQLTILGTEQTVAVQAGNVEQTLQPGQVLVLSNGSRS